MIQKIKNNLIYHPLFLVLVNPLALILFGTSFSLRFAPIHWGNFCLFYLFVLIAQFIENILNNASKNQQKLRFIPLALFELLGILICLYFGLQLNYLVALLMLIYLFAIHFQFYPYDISKTVYNYILTAFFKGGLLTYLAFFIQTQFISKALYSWSLPLIVLTAFCSFGRQYALTEGNRNKKRNQIIFLALLGTVYLAALFPILTLAGATNYAWLLLLSLPVALRLVIIFKATKNNNPAIKSKATFLFNLCYTILLSILVLLQNKG